MTPKRFTLACSGNAAGFSMTKFQNMGAFVLIPVLPISAKFDVLEQTLTTCFADGALLHQAKSTMEFLQRTVPNFIEPSVWPPSVCLSGSTLNRDGCPQSPFGHIDRC